jgi:ABC-2 type transport system ATP-binding protein
MFFQSPFPRSGEDKSRFWQDILVFWREEYFLSTAISTVDLTKRFARTSGYRDLFRIKKRQWITAVENVSLDIKEGEFFGFLGPNGAGKTTFIKMLCTLVLPSSGKASIFGHNVEKEDQTVKKLVGLVNAEERSFYWRLNGRENLQFYASINQLFGKQAKDRIDFLLKMVELDKQSDMRFQNYSTGMRQKLAIARGLLSDPKVLFVDEPTRSLDPVSAQAVRAFLKEKVIGEKKTVVLATHNLTEAEQLCDRLAIMDHGRVIALGSVKELRALFQTHEECSLEVRNLRADIFKEIGHVENVITSKLTEDGHENSIIELKIVKREQVLPRLMHILVESGAEIRNCQLKELPLEDIFAQVLNSGEKGRN